MTSIIVPHYQAMLDAVHTIADQYFYSGRVQDALTLLENAIPISQAAEVPPSRRVDILLHRAGLMIDAALSFPGYDHLKTLALLQDAARATANDQQRAQALELTGKALYYQSLIDPKVPVTDPDYESFSHYFLQSLPLYREHGDFRGECSALFHLGLMAERQERLIEAETQYWESIDIARNHGFKREQSFSVRHLGFLALRHGDLRAAEDLLLESLRLRQEIGYVIGQPYAHLALVHLYLLQNRPDKAVKAYTQGTYLIDDLQLNGPGIMVTLLGVGEVLVEHNLNNEAQDSLKRAQRIARNLNHEWGLKNASNALLTLPGAFEEDSPA